jgi:photosystem II PsbY protein
MQVFKKAALTAVAASMLMGGQVSAATEIAAVAGDSRVGILATLLLPVAGWVLFNIFGPTKNQLDGMSNKGVAVGLGLAGLLAAGSAEAAQEVAMTAGDSRVGILATLLLPVAGWVLFNIFGPTKNQLDGMSNKGVAVGLGLAGVLAAGSAEAAQEVAMTAGDSRVGILATLLLPVAGWVLFNILGPAKSQLDNMGKK